jgi:hypothetical protein
MADDQPLPPYSRRWRWQEEHRYIAVVLPAFLGLVALVRARHVDRSFLEAVLEGLFTAIVYFPFSVLWGVTVEPEPRWWQLSPYVAFPLWMGMIPAMIAWLADYCSLTDALILGGVASLMWAIILLVTSPWRQ